MTTSIGFLLAYVSFKMDFSLLNLAIVQRKMVDMDVAMTLLVPANVLYFMNDVTQLNKSVRIW